MHIFSKSSTFAPDLQNTMNNNAPKYRTPEAYVIDIEVMLDVSHRTAERIMAKIKKQYRLSRSQRPTLTQVKEYLSQE